MKVSKSMEDVWRWKDEIAKEIEGMSSRERIEYFRQAEQKLVEKTGGGVLKLKRFAPSRPRPK